MGSYLTVSGCGFEKHETRLIIQAMALGEVSAKDWWLIVRREFTAGLALGLLLAVIGMLRILI